MELICRGYVPGYSADARLIVEFDRNWQKYRTPKVVVEPLDTLPVRLLSDSDPEAEFEHFPEANL